MGTASVGLLVKLRNDLVVMVSGRCLEALPEIDHAWQPGDLLVYSEVLNETLNAFLSPEEGEEKRKFFGFDQFALGIGPLTLGLGRQPRV